MKNLILTIVFFLLCVGTLLGNEAVTVEKQKRFIRELYRSGRYFDAAAETRRLLSFQGFKDKEDGLFFINVNYFLGGQYRTVIYNIFSHGQVSLRDRVLAARSFNRLGQGASGLQVLKDADYAPLDSIQRKSLFYSRAKIHLSGHNYDALGNEITRVRPYLGGGKSLLPLENELQEFRKMQYKSPALSVILSALIPGAGQIYSGRYIAGFISFIAVAATVVGAYFSFDRGIEGLSYSLIFFSAAFYIGNLYGAFNAARSYNEMARKKYRDDIERKYIPSYDPGGEIMKRGFLRQP